MKTICVIAGNRKQYDDFIGERLPWAHDYQTQPGRAIIDGVQYLYASSPESIRGLSNVEFSFVGLWYQRPDIDELKREAAVRLLGDGKQIPW